MYTEQINLLQQRIEKVSRQYDFCDEVYRELEQKSFHLTARNFIESLIRQRQRLVNIHASRKNDMQMLTIIDKLKVNLDAAARKDLAMARFFLNNEEDIRAIIPGQYPSKRYETFSRLRETAREISKNQISVP